MTDNSMKIVNSPLVSQYFGSFYPALPSTCEALVAIHTICTHSKDLSEDIFKAGAQFVFRLLSCRHFFSQSALRLFYPALPNTCEALVAMHTIFTHSKDLPEDIFKAGAQFVFRLLCCRHLLSSVSQYFGCSILRYQTFARPLLQCISCLHVARTCLGTSLKQVQNFSSYST